jgi:hypothetical protein
MGYNTTRRGIITLLLAVVCAACGGSATTDYDSLWVKFHFVAQERCKDGQFDKATRELSSAIARENPEDARHAVGMLHFGLLNRVLHKDAAADSLIAKAVALSEGVFHVAPGWKSPPGRWFRHIAFPDRQDSQDALSMSGTWYPIWQSALGSAHPDLSVLTCMMAAMEQIEGNYETSDSLFALGISTLETAGSNYRQYAGVLKRLWMGPED